MSSVVTRILDDSLFNQLPELRAVNCTVPNTTSAWFDMSRSGTFNSTITLSNTDCSLQFVTEPGTFMELYGFTPRNLQATSTDDNYTEDLFYNTTTGSASVRFDGPLLLFDYAVASVAELESLHDQTIIVDDSNSNPEIQWGGSWEEKQINWPLLLDSGLGWGLTVNAKPHGNGTHESDSVSDYFIFQFQGSSILVGGVTPMNRTDQTFIDVFGTRNTTVSNFHLRLNFTLDGHSQVVVFTNETLSQPIGTPHFPYFRNDSLAEGNHTLIMTVDDVTGNTSVVIDYLTYKPSFATLKDKPTFPPIVFNDNSTSSSNTPPGPRSNTGTIAGSVVGGVIFLGLLALGIWLLYKRKRQVRQLDQWGSTNIPAMSNLAVEPFLFQNPTNPLPKKDTPSIPRVQPPPLAASWVPSLPQHAELRRQREELEETMQNLESQNVDTRSSDQNLVTQDQIREILTRLDVLTREMGRYVEPPGYDSR
ncbi:hypothetical protein K435DRAFT_879897 [Dendrothele bispora CBS 962.96]|uniref:Epidermal growth factor receptor-like transmembrane-juxtamembrane segment domain-containing protein n=1 Tax=Dendrothele bispora (strain CBS 962.96) TaxID=1314807 RepID=A0A4S8KKD7_DENBC|nr:hypothetical protein K435DRAFT_879897 [Dendrothele bispora CBS 962.96]